MPIPAPKIQIISPFPAILLDKWILGQQFGGLQVPPLSCFPPLQTQQCLSQKVLGCVFLINQLMRRAKPTGTEDNIPPVQNKRKHREKKIQNIPLKNGEKLKGKRQNSFLRKHQPPPHILNIIKLLNDQKYSSIKTWG